MPGTSPSEPGTSPSERGASAGPSGIVLLPSRTALLRVGQPDNRRILDDRPARNARRSEVVVVNPPTTEIPDRALRALRDRALQATAVPIALLDAALEELPVVWVNDAFEKVTGYSAAEFRERQATVVD